MFKTKCGVCNSDDRIKIERDLILGNQYAEIERKYGFKYWAIKRHEKAHMSKEVTKNIMHRIPQFKVPKISMNKLTPSINNLRDCIEYWHNEMNEMYLDAKSKNKPYLQFAAAAQARGFLTLAKDTQELAMQASSQLSWEHMVPHILNAVKDYPEAKIAISMALRDKELKVTVDDVLQARDYNVGRKKAAEVYIEGGVS